MRFLTGLCVGILMWFLYQFFGLLTLVSESYTIFMILAFIGIFLGPLYYWVIEPLRGGEKSKSPLIRVSYHSSKPRFCGNCGKPNTNGIYCIKCGTKVKENG